MNERWEEVKIEDVHPGDVARCNGREFEVERVNHSMQGFAYLFKICGEELSVTLLKEMGITFWRKVKREPRTFETSICDSGQLIHAPVGWPAGTLVRVTEILDGEDGA